MDCEAIYQQLRRDMKEGTTRYRIMSKVNELRQRILEYGNQCSKGRANFLEIVLDYSYGLYPIDQALSRLTQLLEQEAIDGKTQIFILIFLARLTLATIPFNENSKYRDQALGVARKNEFIIEELVILVNWLFAATAKKDFEQAKRLANELELRIDAIQPEVQSNSEYQEIQGRFLTHKAKILIQEACSIQGQDADSLIEQANDLYRKAINLDKEIDHRRINYQIEWVQKLVECFEQIEKPDLSLPETILEQASYGLDSHYCDLCRGYYHDIKAYLLYVKGNTKCFENPTEATQLWRQATIDGNTSIEYFSKSNHPYIHNAKATLERIRSSLIMAEKPRRIFLSHSSADKDLVREFKNTLELLRFDPWLDEDAMAAGVKLERGLLQGLKDSCAAVFFITPNFKDEGYLETEVDYAVAEKRKKGSEFAIVALVFRDEAGNAVAIPELLQPYIWKTPQTHLEALRELVRALPLRVSYPAWK